MQTNRLKEAPGFTFANTAPETRERLAAYRDQEGHSNSTIARELGVSPATVSLYISGKYRGNTEQLDEKAENILRNAPIRKIVAADIFETGVTSAIGGAITTILKTNDFAIIHGPAGIGKTCGAANYVAANPTAIFVTLYQDCCNAHYLQKEIFEFVKSRAFKGSGKNRTEWIFDRLKASNRLIIIDNGQRATKAARKWLFDLHDKTGCPIVLLGNPEIIDAIKENDQQFSRIGLCPEVSLDKDEIPAVAKLILQQMCPKLATELLPYAVAVASHRGHLRALAKQIKLTLNFMARGEHDARAAFRAAHTQLVRNYSLA